MSDRQIRDVEGLRAVIGEPMDFVLAKILTELNEAMVAFIAQTPLIFVSTLDAKGRPDVSPKGDPADFVVVRSPTELLIPERKGNRLTFGFVNMLSNPEVGLTFVVPRQLETLRVKGRASLHTDPEVLQEMAVDGKPALLYTRIEVSECFFHCGKALVRSHLWQPEAWPQETRSIAAKGMVSKTMVDEQSVRRTEAALDHSYRDELY